MRSPLRAAFALLCGATALVPRAASAEELIRTTGTGTALGTMRLIAAAYEKAIPGRRIQILPSVGSAGAFRAVARGAIDVGLSARPLKRDEYDLGLVTIPYARTPFLFVAGPRAEAKDLTLAEVIRIYRGELLRWPNGERLRLVLRPRADADTAILRGVSPELAAAVDVALGREGMLMAATNQDCVAMLQRTPGSLGLSSLTQTVTERLGLTPLTWHGVAPTLENLASGAYPLEKTLYLVLKAPASAPVRRFVAFLSTPEARQILERAGNLPVALPDLE